MEIASAPQRLPALRYFAEGGAYAFVTWMRVHPVSPHVHPGTYCTPRALWVPLLALPVQYRHFCPSPPLIIMSLRMLELGWHICLLQQGSPNMSQAPRPAFQ